MTGRNDTAAVLKAVDLTLGYGPLAAVSHLDLHVASGEIVGLLGANGAGKTTSLLGFAGELRPLAGHVELFGQETRQPLHQRARRGLAYVPEQRAIFRKLTVAANLRLGLGSVDGAIQVAPELEPLMNRPAGLLSGGEQQILVLARALAARPRLLLVDELSLGLAPTVVTRMLGLITDAAAAGAGVLVVDQGVHSVLGVAHRAYVLRRGRVVISGSTTALRRQTTEIQAAYLAVGDERSPAGAAPRPRQTEETG